MHSAKEVISTHGVACVKRDAATGHHSLHAVRSFAEGDVITPFTAQATLPAPTHLTIQLDSDRHISLSPSFLQYVNHSCAPNCFFDTAAMAFVAVQPISEGDELCFFYPSTEWDMAQAFDCHCHSIACLGTVQGAAYLPEDVLQQYKVTDFIASKVRERMDERA